MTGKKEGKVKTESVNAEFPGMKVTEPKNGGTEMEVT